MIRKKGKIVKWNDEKGYGFILPMGSKKNIFVHIKSFSDRTVRPAVDQNVIFSIEKNTKGQDAAINVSRSTDNPLKNKNSNIRVTNNILKQNRHINKNSTRDDNIVSGIPMIYILIIICFSIYVLYFTIMGVLPPFVILVYLVMGILTYFIYSEDKAKAIDDEYRTSEQRLLSLSFFGGWMGALIAQHKFRHKTKKTSFQISFWTTVFFNVLLLSSFFRIVHF